MALASIRIVIDVGYGELLPLLDQPAPKRRDYPLETVIAEKFQAMMDRIDRAREGRENTGCASMHHLGLCLTY